VIFLVLGKLNEVNFSNDSFGLDTVMISDSRNFNSTEEICVIPVKKYLDNICVSGSRLNSTRNGVNVTKKYKLDLIKPTKGTIFNDN
jgi:flavorubredoxin